MGSFMPVPTNYHRDCHAIVIKLSSGRNHDVSSWVMAKTLREFLQDRAQWDAQALKCAYTAVPPTGWLDKTIKGLLAAHRHEDGVVLPSDMVWEAAQVCLSQAGEALDVMRETEPELFKQLPQYPWNSIIRLRHVVTHYGPANEAAFRPDAAKTMTTTGEKEYAKLLQCKMPPDTDVYDKSALYRQAMHSLRFFSFYGHLATGFGPDENIPVTYTPRVEALMDDFGLTADLRDHEGKQVKWSLPLAIMVDSLRHRANMATESFEKTSGLCRMSHPEIFSSPSYAAIRNMRNQWAHFQDRLASEDAQSMTDPNFIFFYPRLMDQVRMSFRRMPSGEPSDAAHLIDDYATMILGRAQNDPAKAAAMDQFVSWFVKNFNGKMRLQEAAIYATGQTLQLPLAQAAEILDYIRAHKTDLQTPGVLLDDLPKQSHVLQIGVRDYVENMQEILGVDKQRVTLIDMQASHTGPLGLKKTPAVSLMGGRA